MFQQVHPLLAQGLVLGSTAVRRVVPGAHPRGDVFGHCGEFCGERVGRFDGSGLGEGARRAALLRGGASGSQGADQVRRGVSWAGFDGGGGGGGWVHGLHWES